MRCKKNGVVAVWNKSHAYAGDLFECPKCGLDTLVTNRLPHLLDELEYVRLKRNDDLLEMT